ncbi:MAG TPA: MlaE family lipid ABC transporter permease subunit [Micropepsaceae bacterium]|nr:MlaE family lipid ABC transporter permease subunit [Micropepsaceae bacterium]
MTRTTGHDGQEPLPEVTLTQSAGQPTLVFSGTFTIYHAREADRVLNELALPRAKDAVIDLSAVTRLDTTGAYLAHRTELKLAAQGARVTYRCPDEDWLSLIRAIASHDAKPTEPHHHPNAFVRMLERLGTSVIGIYDGARDALGFTGQIFEALGRAIISPRRLRFTSLVHHMEQAGIDAIPIVFMMSFLVGSVTAYQGAEQLARFGAEVFTVNLVAVSFLREVGILLTAIMVAGRSGSAFTAQIGSMKMREEIDAMRVLGLDPIEVLVLPRVLALVIMLPFLGFIADLAGMLGGGIVAMLELGMSPAAYLDQFRASLGEWTFWIGIIKAPVFAFLIGLIGCYEGMRVSGSAESVGRRTTQSVVEGIFVVIIADAFFSVMFAELGI